MTTSNDEKKFLVNDLDGNPMYVGDKMYSLFHNQFVVLEGIWVDETDGEVFVCCDAGTARVASLCRISQKTINMIENRKEN
jgi:hypothetical protein